MVGVLRTLEPKEEVAESESGDERGRSNNFLVDFAEGNKDKGKPKNKQVEQSLVLISEEGDREKV